MIHRYRWAFPVSRVGMVRSRGPWSLLTPVGFHLFLLRKQASETLDTHLSSHSYGAVKVVSFFSSLTVLGFWVP